jgi:hypothetical protein
MKKTLIAISFLLILSLAFAGNYRVNGMGGAGLAVIDDVSAVTHNPSLMGNSGFLNLRLLGADLTINKRLSDLLQQVSKDATVSKFSDDFKSGDSTKISSDITYLLKNYASYLNDDLYFDGEFNSGLILNLAILQVGVGGNLRTNALLNFDTANLAVDTFDVNLVSKVGVAVSTGLPFFKIGLGLYDLAKVRINEPQGTSVTQLATDLQKAPNLENTISGDLSTTLQLGDFRVSAVSKNVITSPIKTYSLDNNFNGNIVVNDIPAMISNLTFNASNIMRNMNLGVAFINKNSGFILSAQVDNFQDFLDRVSNGPTADNPSFVKYLHFGVEKRLLPFLTVRAGLNQGYPTFGGDIFLLLGKIGFTYYGSEAGMLAGDQVRQNFELHLDLLF